MGRRLEQLPSFEDLERTFEELKAETRSARKEFRVIGLIIVLVAVLSIFAIQIINSSLLKMVLERV